MVNTPSCSSTTMSPFADKPELWLTGHLQRLHTEENTRKIQAVVKGFLYRRRSQRKEAESLDNLQPLTVAEFLRTHGLATLANMCPSKDECLSDSHLNGTRQECLFHAKITLRLLGKSHLVSELEWCDYHEGRGALDAHQTNKQESLWTTLTKFVLG